MTLVQCRRDVCGGSSNGNTRKRRKQGLKFVYRAGTKFLGAKYCLFICKKYNDKKYILVLVLYLYFFLLHSLW